MSTTFWLTDEDSDVQGYKRLKLGGRSDTPSLVRAVTATQAGPTSGLQLTRSSGGAELRWISDPLDGTDLTAAAWEFHLHAKESAASANAALRFQVLRWRHGAEDATALDDNGQVELGTSTVDYNRATGVATATAMNDRDRLVVRVLVDDASGGSLAAGQTVTVSYNGEHQHGEGDSFVVCPDTLQTTYAVPSATVAQIRRAVSDLGSDGSYTNSFLTDAQIGDALGEALREYSHDRPRRLVASLSGDGTTYDFPLPSRWVLGLSGVEEVEYPAGEQYRAVLDPDDYLVVERVLGGQPVRALRFLSTPSSGTDNIQVRYTTRHEHNDEVSSVVADDFPALCALAGAVACEMAAAKAAQTMDQSISADAVDHGQSNPNFLKVAWALRGRYRRLVRGDSADLAAAGRTRDWDTNQSWRGDWLFHGRRNR